MASVGVPADDLDDRPPPDASAGRSRPEAPQTAGAAFRGTRTVGETLSARAADTAREAGDTAAATHTAGTADTAEAPQTAGAAFRGTRTVGETLSARAADTAREAGGAATTTGWTAE